MVAIFCETFGLVTKTTLSITFALRLWSFFTKDKSSTKTMQNGSPFAFREMKNGVPIRMRCNISASSMNKWHDSGSSGEKIAKKKNETLTFRSNCIQQSSLTEQSQVYRIWTRITQVSLKTSRGQPREGQGCNRLGINQPQWLEIWVL